ncbi:clavesin-2-like [Maniola hyperantus]|uniref:clavesin-2-like n=1 Tax=Aphantopus hyperantus TaxID=2795564 RepID=UPI001569B922|nr:clavesin-2-like [Maniola hyperantus]XP_034833308.1 clavesin-2-like [Maniola hyperantus]XP_034833309.1 clavesin-2-like [Maniola hyperantus]XP_034833310.1 clavesin-2-like [Maniola hyperantus]
MYECFLEIAFEAELNTKEDPELLAIAQEQCNENPDTRASAIMELRQMIFEHGEVKPHRTDDEYLLRFLRSRDFIVRRAYKLLVRYYAFREQYPALQKGVDLWGLVKVKVYEGVILDRPDVGRLSIVRWGMWDPNEMPLIDLLRAGMAVSEIGVRQPKLQVFGGTLLVDMEGITMRHLAAVTPTLAYQIVSLLGTAMPTKVRSCHIVNYSWVFNTIFYIFKRFIPQGFWNRLHFHGSDMNSLHQHVARECLPARYGGTCRSHFPSGLWLQKIKKYRDEDFDREMKALGYVVKE